MTPKEYKQMMDYLTRSGIKDQVKFASDIARPEPKREVVEIEAINRFMRDNPMAYGGRIGFADSIEPKVEKFKELVKKGNSITDAKNKVIDLFKLKRSKTAGTPVWMDVGKKQLVKEDPVLTYSEAKNQKTWQYETSGKLMDQGYKIADELLVESIVNDPKKFTQKAKKLSKKPGNEGRIFYFPKGDQYFILEGGAFKPFELPGEKKDNNKETLKKTNNVTEEVDGITNYEYGTGDKRDQTRDIRQKTSQLKGPINNPNRLYDTSMNKGQKSAYERYLSDYRNQ